MAAKSGYLLTSFCLSCPISARINVLKELGNIIDNEKNNIIILLGKGNDPSSIQKYAREKAIDDTNITIGIINNIEGFFSDNYYRIFKLENDPRLVVLNRTGEVEFIEDEKNFRKISASYLKRLAL